MHDKPEDQRLLEVAEAVSDGKPVDWEAAESAHGHLRGKLKHLRLVEAVAAVHQTASALRGGREILADSEATTQCVGPGPVPGETPESPANWGPLRILELLSRGGFGEVYRAYDPSLQREVALKLRRPDRSGAGDAEERFLNEARRLARIRHPNVLTVHGADEHEGRVGLWTDLIRGRTLEEVLAERGPLGAQEACLVGMDLCRALAAVHAAGLVHRDIKTSNVMREQGGRTVLMDFGSVTELSGAAHRAGGGETSGTPLYMSPEQLRGGDPTSASDIYSLGVLLYRLVSGRFPAEASSFEELLEKHRQGAYGPLRDVRPDLPPPFVHVVERALAAEPGKRFASVGALERALADSMGLALSGEAVGAGAAQDFRKKRRVRWLPIAAVLALAILGGVLTARRLLWPGPFRAEATLFRDGSGAEERLRDGARIRPGDELFLEIEGPEEMYVYVVNEDRMGNAYVLFPAGLAKENPLAPGVKHRLPGRLDGAEMSWAVTSAGGREDFLVVASRTPLPDLERDLAGLPRVEKGREIAYAPVSAESKQTLRGIGGLREAAPSKRKGSEPRVSGIAREISADAENRGGIWTWRIQLENPAD